MPKEVTRHAHAHGPLGSAIISQPARPAPSQPVIPKGSIFEKLTDSSQYTGSHKERFDEQGQGKGLAGRDFTPTGGGTTFQAPHSPGAAAFKGDTNAKTDTVFKDSSEFLVRR